MNGGQGVPRCSNLRRLHAYNLWVKCIVNVCKMYIIVIKYVHSSRSSKYNIVILYIYNIILYIICLYTVGYPISGPRWRTCIFLNKNGIHPSIETQSRRPSRRSTTVPASTTIWESTGSGWWLTYPSEKYWKMMEFVSWDYYSQYMEK